MFRFITNKTVKILILGDLILDRYIEGDVVRISPEAPVPVLFQASDRDVLGGAGNVANNIRALGGEAVLVGVLGRDDAAERIKQCADLSGTKLFAVTSNSRRTSVKTRLLGNRQQLLRVDSEDLIDLDQETELKLLDCVLPLIIHADAIIISDYRKGTLTPLVLKQTIETAKKHNIRIFVDPKGGDYNKYIGADFIKPNRRELELLTRINCNNFEGVSKAATFLSDKTGSNVLVTLSQDGMVLFKIDGTKFVLPTEAKAVFDVSGAGDTTIAAFVFALSHGETQEDAARFANISSGIAVSKVGTATVSLHEIIVAVNQHHTSTVVELHKQADLLSASNISDDWRKQGLKIGFTNGCFDLLHPGHISLLRGAAAECDRLIVGLNSDTSIRRLKGPYRPIQGELARAEVLSAIECIDLVVVFDDDTPLSVIQTIRPDVLIKGSDYEEKDIIGGNFVKANGGSIVRVQILEGHSTSNLVKRLYLSSTDVSYQR